MTHESPGRILLAHIVTTLQENKERLSQLDGAAGDGDHGINMSKGAAIAARQAEASGSSTIHDSLSVLGETLLFQIGGSMGPLYGSLFLGVASAAPETDAPLSIESVQAMLHAGQARVQEQTSAKIGDKTMIDVLEPAIAAFQSAAKEGASLEECLDRLLLAADAGLESTRNLAAKVGRAARLGERSKGHLDAGAASCALILHALARGILEIRSTTHTEELA